MSDDDLLSRTNELLGKMNWAQRFAGSGQGLQQMTTMLGLIEDERRERIFMDQWHLAEAQIAEPIETDPVLRDAERAARERAKPAPPVRSRPRVSARRPFPVVTPHQFGAPLRPPAAPVIPANGKPATKQDE
jgi:hypothetical protein